MDEVTRLAIERGGNGRKTLMRVLAIGSMGKLKWLIEMERGARSYEHVGLGLPRNKGLGVRC